MQSVMLKVAKFALHVKPFFLLQQIHRGMHSAYPTSWVKCKNPNLTVSATGAHHGSSTRNDMELLFQTLVFHYRCDFI